MTLLSLGRLGIRPWEVGKLTPAQLDALNVAMAQEQASLSGEPVEALVAEVLGGLPTSAAENEAWARRAEEILAREREVTSRGG